MYRVSVTSNAEQLAGRMTTMPARIAGGLRSEMDKQNRLTIQHIARTRMSFPRESKPGMAGLRVITGNLRRGLVAGFIPAYTYANSMVIGGMGNRVKYARIHEFGGKIGPRGLIRPKKASALRFVVGGRVVFAKYVNQTRPIDIPARAPMQKGIAERTDNYRTGFAQVMQRVFRDGA